MAASRRATAAVLLAWSLLVVGDALRHGDFAYPNIALVIAGFVVLVVVVAAGVPLVVPDRSLLIGPVLVCLVMAAVLPAHHDMVLHLAAQDTTDVLCVAAAALAGAGMFVSANRQRYVWAGVLVIALATGLVIFIHEPLPTIDVWTLLQQSSEGLRHGDDMYRQHWVHSTGLQTVYPYLPLTTVVLAPFRLLLGDVRYGLLAAVLLSAWLVRRLAPEAPVALAALLLILPHWAFYIHQSWTEPLLIAALAGAILAIRSDRPGLAIVMLAAALACKQHIVVLLPLFAVWPSFGLRRTIAAAGLALLAVLPWIIAGPRDIWHDAVHANLDLKVQTRALNLPSLLARHGVTVGFWFVLLLLAAAYALTITRVPRTASGLALGSGFIMWTLDIANKQTYFNHYMLPAALLVIAVAAAERPSDAVEAPPIDAPAHTQPAAASV